MQDHVPFGQWGATRYQGLRAGAIPPYSEAFREKRKAAFKGE